MVCKVACRCVCLGKYSNVFYQSIVRCDVSLIENHARFELARDQHEQECSARGGDYVAPTPQIETQEVVVDDKTENLPF